MLTVKVIEKSSLWINANSIFLFVYTLAFILIGDQKTSQYLLLAYPFVLLLSFGIYLFQIIDSINSGKIEYSWIYATYILFVITFLYDISVYVYGLANTFHIYKLFGILLYLIVLTVICINKFVFLNIRKDEREIQIKRDAMWTDRIIAACSHIFAQKDIYSFCIQTAKCLKELVIKDMTDQRSGTVDDAIQDENISINVGIKSIDRYTEIFSEGSNPHCNYQLIEDKHINKMEEQVCFGKGYIDILLFEKGKIICIIHLEGISNGLSNHLKNVFMMAYSNIAVALDNLSLKFDMTRTQETIFFNLADISEAKSEETGVHPKRVAEYVRIICEEMLMAPQQIEIVSRASMMHDIGKLAIPEEIITKKGLLTTREYETVKQHVLFGYHIMSKSPGDFMQAAAIIAQQHHERWNGEGYLGLKGEEIHPYARIVSLVDVFDALLSERSYKPAWSFEQTCSYINEKSGIQFDPKVVQVFNRVFYRLYEIREKNPN
jgi:HD-GYP domain-containing protein (c-di-GMP phosphodiesterase class II)